jgi:mutual gliding-motility protein MglA
MAIVNHELREITFKLVYAGTPVSGKTTNLGYIHHHLRQQQQCGNLVSIATSQDRTMYFDYVPVTSVMVRGYRTKFALYTVPGQVRYHATRQLVLQGADGVVFVADSQADRLEENVEAARQLVRALTDNRTSLENVPLVLQYNKRDLPNAAPRHYLDYLLNQGPQVFPVFEAVATTGYNVFATLNALSQLVLERSLGPAPAPAPAARPASEPVPMPA